MKVIYVMLLLLADISFGQTSAFQGTAHWKLYDVEGHGLFKYSIDSLKHFSFYSLNEDSMQFFLRDVKELPADDSPIWMGGPHIATYEKEGSEFKIDISHYGGFFIDERTKRYYQVTSDKIDDWLSYIRGCFVAGHVNK